MKVLALLLAGLAALAPPAGRPPIGPVERGEPRLYDVRYEVTISTLIPLQQDDPNIKRYKEPVRVQPNVPRARPKPERPEIGYGGVFDLADTPIVMPVIMRGTYSAVDHRTLEAELWLDTGRVADLARQVRLEEDLPHHVHAAVIPIQRFRGKEIRWVLQFRAQSYSSRVDDEAAARVAWPREWPKEVAAGLEPQMYVESNDPLFAETLARLSAGSSIRLMPPYIAAKEIVRWCIGQLQVTGDGLHRGRQGILHGLDVQGAKHAATLGRGGPHDLVCVCVAMLRAAGIPARPVIGIQEDEQGRNELVSWAEFFLPDAGWVPFDPAEMRGKALRNRDVRHAWPEFGTMSDLNRRVPLAYHFMPPRAVESPQNAALWGWDPRPAGAPAAEQRITIGLVSRGAGVPDQR